MKVETAENLKPDTAAKPAEPKPIKPETRELADRIAQEITEVNTNGIATVSADTYIKLLPESLTEAQVHDLNKYNTSFIAAAALAVGEKSIPVMKKHGDLDRVTATFPTTGKDNIEVVFDRTRQVPTRERDGDGNLQTTGTTTKFGSVTVGVNMYGTRSRGDLLKVKDMLAKQAQDSFGS